MDCPVFGFWYQIKICGHGQTKVLKPFPITGMAEPHLPARDPKTIIMSFPQEKGVQTVRLGFKIAEPHHFHVVFIHVHVLSWFTPKMARFKVLGLTPSYHSFTCHPSHPSHPCNQRAASTVDDSTAWATSLQLDFAQLKFHDGCGYPVPLKHNQPFFSLLLLLIISNSPP